MSTQHHSPFPGVVEVSYFELGRGVLLVKADKET